MSKVLLTNLSELERKYRGATEILAALNRLIEADHDRGVETRLIALDSAEDMGSFQAQRAHDASEPRQYKDAVDAVYRALQPDYIALLGAVDVIPHQNLRNPAYEPGVDDDEFALGDLPYACEAGYSQDPQDFTGVTRVVGRIPDITGG